LVSKSSIHFECLSIMEASSLPKLTSCQTCDDLVEWLTHVKKNLQYNMLGRKPSCFIIDDVP